ncbi:hypothetical protein [Tsukamurella soli]|uniref:CHAT domain-containing protein n=1 Tax=Tsukamurella soli TaxID=644556 RepID=A0ABP8JQ27_9ACTN
MAKKRLLAVGYQGSRLYTLAKGHPAVELIGRGRTKAALGRAVEVLGSCEADLVVLEGHGSLRDGAPIYWSSDKSDQCVEFKPPKLKAPAVILSMCHGGSPAFVDAVRNTNVTVRVLGPIGQVYSGACAGLVHDVVEDFLNGASLHAAFTAAQARGNGVYAGADQWHLV